MSTIGKLNYQITSNTSGFTKGVVATRQELALAKRVMADTLTPAEQLGESIDGLRQLFHKELITLEQYNRAVKQLEQSTPAAIAAQEQLAAAVARGKAVTESVVSPTERYAAEQAELTQLLDDGHISQETYTRAMAKAAQQLPEVQAAQQAATKAQAEYDAELRRGEALTASLRTPNERYRATLADLDGQLKRGTISQETYARAVRAAKLEKLGGIPVIGKFASGLASMHPAALAAGASLAIITGAAALVARGINGISQAIQEQLPELDKLAKSADRLGLTGQQLRELRFAAGEIGGVETDAFDKSIAKMNRGIAEAAAGTGEAREALAALGLDARQLQQSGPEAAFLAMADALETLGDPMDRQRVAAKLFGEDAAGMINVMKAGRATIEGTAAEFRGLTRAMTEMDLARVQEANDAMGRAKIVFAGLAEEATIAVAPALTLIAEELVELTKEGSQFGETMRMGIELLGPALAFAGDSLGVMIGTFQGYQADVLDGLSLILVAAQKVDEGLAFISGRAANAELKALAETMSHSAVAMRKEADARRASGLAGEMSQRFQELAAKPPGAGGAATNDATLAEAAAVQAAVEREAAERQKIEDLAVSTLDSLALQLASVGKSADEATRMRLAMQGLDSETLEIVEAMQQQIAAAQELADAEKRRADEQAALETAVDSLAQRWAEQAVTLGMSSEEIELFRLAQQGASEEQLAGARASKAALDSMREYNEAMEAGRRLTEQFATPAEKAGDQLDELEQLLAMGAITQDVFAAAVAKTRDELAPPITTSFDTEGLDSAIAGSQAFAEAIAAQRDAINAANTDTLQASVAQGAVDQGITISEFQKTRTDPAADAAQANQDVLERIAETLERVAAATEASADAEPLDVEEVTIT